MTRTAAMIIIVMSLAASYASAQMPTVASGTIKRFEKFPSKYVDARTVDVWLPANYDGRSRFSVLYMQDGQMLFDSTVTWNRQEWKVDETISSLIRAGKIKNTIVVAIWNNGRYRESEYFPQKALAFLTPTIRDSVVATDLANKPQSDNYLRFIVKELKPFIDSAFRTITDRSHTHIAGSSFGGLISFYAVCEYPEVFEGAACISTHWPGTLPPKFDAVPKAFARYAAEHLPSPKIHKFYFDLGSETLDSYYKPLQTMIDAVMRSRGYGSSNWITRIFPGDDHSERSWSRRLSVPLSFLLKK